MVVGKVMLLIRSLYLFGLKYIHASIILKMRICNWISFLKNFESGYFNPVHDQFMTYFKSAKLIPWALIVRAWQQRMWTASSIVYACRLNSLGIIYVDEYSHLHAPFINGLPTMESQTLPYPNFISKCM